MIVMLGRAIEVRFALGKFSPYLSANMACQ
jgi:hypothetical protein